MQYSDARIILFWLSGNFSTKILEFWKYVTNPSDKLSRHKRISDPEEQKHTKHLLRRVIKRSPAETTRQLDSDGNDQSTTDDQAPNIVTLSSKTVPNDDGLSGEDNGSALEKSEIQADIRWPAGRYGLPQSINGCPSSRGFMWKRGYRYHDTEDDGTENQHSDNFHLASNFTEDGIRHDFCIKDSEVGDSSWPAGKYCVYKRGSTCPAKMKEGFVIWDDENTDNQNEAGGALPEGLYSDDTKILFCCMTDGHVDKPIRLPSDSDFFLFSYQSIKCQKVEGMKASSEFLKFDDEDHGNIDYEGGAYPYGIHKAQKDHMLFLCYYEIDPQATRSNVMATSEKEIAKAVESKESDALDKEEDQQALKKSEEMMRAFLKATGGEEEDSNKSERTRTIIKTIKACEYQLVPVGSKSYPTAIIVGLVLGGVVISTTIIILAKYIVNRGSNSGTPSTPKSSMVETKWTSPEMASNMIDVESDDDISMIGSDFGENEMDELVEDQLLPDSELKSGLELLFLKQQRHYWNQRKKHEGGSHNSSHEM
eukprot:gene12893-14220_t